MCKFKVSNLLHPEFLQAVAWFALANADEPATSYCSVQTSMPLLLLLLGPASTTEALRHAFSQSCGRRT